MNNIYTALSIVVIIWLSAAMAALFSKVSGIPLVGIVVLAIGVYFIKIVWAKNQEYRSKNGNKSFFSFFSNYNQRKSYERIDEEALYEQVAQELKDGYKKEGLYTKAMANSEGIESKAISLYIKYRVQALKDEITIKQSNYETERQSDYKPAVKLEKVKKEQKIKEEKEAEKFYNEKENIQLYLKAPIISFIIFSTIVIIVFKVIL